MGGWPQRTTGKPALTCVPHAGAIDRLHGATPLWSLLAMVACGKPLSIVTPTRANLFLLWLPREPTARENSKGNIFGQKFQQTFSINFSPNQAISSNFFSSSNSKKNILPWPPKKSLFDIRKWSHSNCAILIGHSTHHQTLPHTCKRSKCLNTKGYYLTIDTNKNQGGGGGEGTKNRILGQSR